MNQQLLKLLAHPKSKNPLLFSKGNLQDPGSGEIFPIIDGIPIFLREGSMPFVDRWISWIYDRTAFAYDFTMKLGTRVNLASEENVRASYIQELSLKPASRVLEIGAGTAANRSFLPSNIFYLGLDTSINMLRIAQKRCNQNSVQAQFVQSDAHNLPIIPNSFELVICMGALQHFSNPLKACNEMWHVIKPGGVIHILEERTRLPKLPDPDMSKEPSLLAERLFPDAPKASFSTIENSDYVAFQINKPPPVGIINS